jgi:hypothetical protein
MLILPSWVVKKGLTEDQRDGPEQWNRITEKGTIGQLIGLGERERRMGNKEQRLKIREKGRETRNRDVRLGTEDKRQGTEMWGWETRNREVRQGTEDGRKGTEKWGRD